MAYLIGADEAGYGPNLGPLVVALSAWRVPDERRYDDLYELLSEAISADAGDSAARLAIADSKRLYKSGAGADDGVGHGELRQIETGVLAAAGLASGGAALGSWREIWGQLAETGDDELTWAPWFASHDEPAPIDACPVLIAAASQQLASAAAQAGVELKALRAVVYFPRRFNAAVQECGSKGDLLSRATLGLVARTLDDLPEEPVLVGCDKHGGRNKYAPLLQSCFPDRLIEVRHESREESRYACGPRDCRWEFRFTVGGERFLPAALASMTAKYLRELAMRPFNAFWRRYAPGLRPTAGYPGDARRFMQEIAPAQKELQIGADVLWRQR